MYIQYTFILVVNTLVSAQPIPHTLPLRYAPYRVSYSTYWIYSQDPKFVCICHIILSHTLGWSC